MRLEAQTLSGFDGATSAKSFHVTLAMQAGGTELVWELSEVIALLGIQS